MTTDATLHPDRLAAVRRHDPEAADLVERLLLLAPRGLAAAHLGEGGFAQTLRGHRGSQGTVGSVHAEGSNPRYAAMAALGLARLPDHGQRQVLEGRPATALLGAGLDEASRGEPGALALTAWAQAEVSGQYAERALRELHALVRSTTPVPTVAVAWAVTAAVAAGPLGDTTALLADGCERLLAHRGPHGIYPHVLTGSPRWSPRRHVGSFADQIYPVQALARAARATGDASLLTAAGETAGLLCHHQGPAGQWAWHYDTRTGAVVERYPVYSVHQHAMAPMVLFDLAEAGGADHADRIALGLRWLLTHPEVEEELVATDLGVVWRKVGRRERAKASRVAASLTTAVRPGSQLPGLDRLLPPTRIDHECRPYELGWLLHAWLAAEQDGAGPPRAAAEGVATP